jgi:hypothetical protein
MAENRDKLQGTKTAEQGGWGITVKFLAQEFPGEKGSVRRCIVVMEQSVLHQRSGQSICTFSPVSIKHHSSMQNLMSGLPEQILCEYSL